MFKKRFVIVQNSMKTVYLFRRSYVLELLKNAQVVIIAPNDSDLFKNKLLELGVEIYQIRSMDSFYNKLISIFQMNFYILIERKRKSIIVLHFLITFLLCYFSAIPFNKKGIVYVEGLGSIFSKNKTFLKILALIFRRVNLKRLFCNNDEKDKLGIKSDIVTGGIGIDLTAFPTKNNIKRQNGFSLLFIGRLINDKGVYDAIEGFRCLRAKGVDVNLTLVGDIYENNPSSLTHKNIEELENEFQSNIRFVSFTADVLSWYKRSDLLLLPSIREGFPVCVMEASSVGLPTVGYLVPGVKDAVSEGVNGLLSPYGDVTKMVDNIESLLSLEVLEKYRNSCSKYANNYFSSENKTKQILRVLDDL